jgi:lysine 2,3-aminomutase
MSEVTIQPRKLTSRESLDAYDTASEPWLKALGRRYTHHSQLNGVLNNVEDVEESIYEQFDFKLTPYLVQLMDVNDPDCPVRRQYLPSGRELDIKPYEILDGLYEEREGERPCRR